MMQNVLASLAVNDLQVSLPWYERLFGPSTRPMSEVAEWNFERGGGLQVYLLPERAGRGSCTVIVDDIDKVAHEIESANAASNVEPVRNDRVDTIMIKDPDGNSIAFAVPKNGSFAG